MISTAPPPAGNVFFGFAIIYGMAMGAFFVGSRRVKANTVREKKELRNISKRMFADGKTRVTLVLDRLAVETLIKSDSDRVILGRAWLNGMKDVLEKEKKLCEKEEQLLLIGR